MLHIGNLSNFLSKSVVLFSQAKNSTKFDNVPLWRLAKSYHGLQQSFESRDNSTMRIIYKAIQVRTEKRKLKEIMVFMHAGHDNVSCHFTIQRYKTVVHTAW